jgi:hypothetical protein
MSLYRLLYRSEIALSGSSEEVHDQIDRIVDASARGNAACDLTGALVASGGVFIQVMEGPLPALEAVFEKVCSDLRHRRVQLIELAAAEERAFPEWRMVRVAQEAEVAEFCRVIGSRDTIRLDVSTTQALVALMRSSLVSGVGPDSGTGVPLQPARPLRCSATNDRSSPA